MRLTHKFSDHNKVVNEQYAEGGAACGADGMAHGEAKKFADGGDVEQPTYWQAVKDRVSELLPGKPSTPAAEQPKHQGQAYDDIVRKAETGE